jgi:HlyD family secretion protein
MVRRLKTRRTLVGVVLLLLVSTLAAALAPMAKSQFLRGADGSADDSVAAGEPSGPIQVQTASRAQANAQKGTLVQRGTISEVLSLSGRVAVPGETPLSVSAPGRVETVAVRPGQSVQAGEILLETDSKQISKDLGAARTRLEVSALRLAELTTQVSGQAAGGGEAARRQRAILEAEAALRRAQADHQRIAAGPDPADVRKAEQDLATARQTLQQAEVDQTRVARGADPAELRRVEQDLAAARQTLQQAEADQARVARGADPAELRKAEQDLAAARQALQRAEADQARLGRGADAAALAGASREQALAESKLQRAQAELARLTRGPDPVELQAAQRDVEQATRAADTAHSGRVAPPSGAAANPSERASRAAAEASAVTALQAAQERLARLRQAPPVAEVDAARREVHLAQMEVDAVRERLETLRRGPDEQTAAAAATATDSARLAVQQAEARLRELQAGPSGDQTALATSKVDSARLAVQQAEARLADVKGRPTRAELAEAQDRVAIAQAGLTQARAGDIAGAQAPTSNSRLAEYRLQQMNVEQDRAQVQALEEELTTTQVRAPAAGIVTAVRARVGYPVQPGIPVITLAPPGTPVVRADLTDEQAARLAVGQQATLKLAGSDSPPVDASIAEIAQGSDGSSRVAVLYVDWPGDPADFNTSADVTVTLRAKADVLILPKAAVRSVGTRRTVEVIESGSRRSIPVELGIVGENQVEIVSGLKEGQWVLLRS